MMHGADAGMDTTCPSPEMADSRKRPLDGDCDNGTTKRSHFSTNGEFYHFYLFYFFNKKSTHCRKYFTLELYFLTIKRARQ